MIRERFRTYWVLTKPLQTGLLLITGLAGFSSSRCPALEWQLFLALTGSLFLAISGSTVLNMIFDRDIDAKMKRTANRPLPSGRADHREALLIGLALSALGVGWALSLSYLYGAVVFGGLFFDVVVYTLWLKRRTAWSIVWGGISGGMPALAGRVLAVGQLDWVGLALALGVLLWIPSHIMTINMRHDEDYRKAGIPTFPSAYGTKMTSVAIAVSSLTAAIAILVAAYGISMTWGYLRLLAVLSVGLLALAINCVARPSERMNFGLFKYASMYLLGSMVLIIVEAM